MQACQGRSDVHGPLEHALPHRLPNDQDLARWWVPCVQTVEPLADARNGLAPEHNREDRSGTSMKPYASITHVADDQAYVAAGA